MKSSIRINHFTYLLFFFGSAFHLFCALNLTLLSSLSNSRVLLSRAQITPHKNTSITFSSALALSGDIDPASSVRLGCTLWRFWECQRKYMVLVWNPGVLKQSVKFGHYSCNSAFMFHSQGSCVPRPQRGFSCGQGCSYRLSRRSRWNIFLWQQRASDARRGKLGEWKYV